MGPLNIVVVLCVSAFCTQCGVALPDISIRLDQSGFPGAAEHEGTVLVSKDGVTWGVVCDDRWDESDGAVACRQLGFPGVEAVTDRNQYQTSFSGGTASNIFLDDMECQGNENSFDECIHREWGTSNCIMYEAAGVKCLPKTSGLAQTPVQPQTAPNSAEPASAASASADSDHAQVAITSNDPTGSTFEVSVGVEEPSVPDSSVPTASDASDNTAESPEVADTAESVMTELDLLLQRINADAAAAAAAATEEIASPEATTPEPENEESTEVDMDEEAAILQTMAELRAHNSRPQTGLSYTVKLTGGRSSREGWVQVVRPSGVRGSICGDNWSIFEATVACRELGLSYARRATQSNFFGGLDEDKVFYEISCEGHEARLGDCSHREVSPDGVKCSRPDRIAGIQCTTRLPDLLPNITALVESVNLQDMSIGALRCSMEENCLSSSAYELRERYPYAYNGLSRRLLRFSSNIFNNGTADFRPYSHRSSWEYHQCHMHYHSMSEFSFYDVLDRNGNRVAEGHKASFCLEDVECNYGARKKFTCTGFGRQGISPGCADIYKHDIDCQWIDVTDLDPGNYIFRVHINPNNEVAELSYDNNAATCELSYTGYSAKLTRCELGRG